VSDAAAYLDTESKRGSFPGAATSPAGDGAPVSTQIASVIAGFEHRLPARLESLKRALKTEDNEAVRDILHQLTGTAGICGHAEISHEARRLLELARAGKLASRPEEMQTLERLVSDVTASHVDDPQAG
ncbi:MAG: Hpt domain-containing protein, partial [Planctomycetes bacterium]|nr:Hpt domain-containing protein [Planctomycetota bacterium]